MQRYSSLFMFLTGILHSVVGFIIFWEPIMDMVRNGLVNSVEPYYDRGSAFWFLFAGLMFFLIAHTMKWFIKNNKKIPKFIGWHLLVLSLLGIIFIPESGFWLVIPQALIILVVPK